MDSATLFVYIHSCPQSAHLCNYKYPLHIIPYLYEVARNSHFFHSLFNVESFSKKSIDFYAYFLPLQCICCFYDIQQPTFYFTFLEIFHNSNYFHLSWTLSKSRNIQWPFFHLSFIHFLIICWTRKIWFVHPSPSIKLYCILQILLILCVPFQSEFCQTSFQVHLTN